MRLFDVNIPVTNYSERKPVNRSVYYRLFSNFGRLSPTLGARDFSCAVSGLGQVFIVSLQRKTSPLVAIKGQRRIGLLATRSISAALNRCTREKYLR